MPDELKVNLNTVELEGEDVSFNSKEDVTEVKKDPLEEIIYSISNVISLIDNMGKDAEKKFILAKGKLQGALEKLN